MCRAFLGSILILPLAIALFFGSAAFPDCHWCQLWSPSTVTSILPNRIRNGRTQKNYSLNVTNCPGLFLPLSAIFLSDINRMFSPSFFFSGYVLDSIVENWGGLTAQLNLAGHPCDAFGDDILNLTIRVTYETTSRCVSAFVPVLVLLGVNSNRY